jgi:hypothetical protein
LDSVPGRVGPARGPRRTEDGRAETRRQLPAGPWLLRERLASRNAGLQLPARILRHAIGSRDVGVSGLLRLLDDVTGDRGDVLDANAGLSHAHHGRPAEIARPLLSQVKLARSHGGSAAAAVAVKIASRLFEDREISAMGLGAPKILRLWNAL